MKAFRCFHGSDLLAAMNLKARTVVLSNRPTIVQLTSIELETYIDWLVAAYATVASGDDFPHENDFDVAIDTSKNQCHEVSLTLH